MKINELNIASNEVNKYPTLEIIGEYTYLRQTIHSLKSLLPEINLKNQVSSASIRRKKEKECHITSRKECLTNAYYHS